MKDDIQSRIQANPKFHKLVSTRNSYSIMMTVLMMICYYGYILLIAFDKELLAKKIGVGVTSLGIPLGLGVIFFTIAITWIYVRRANGEFDVTTQEIIKEAQQ